MGGASLPFPLPPMKFSVSISTPYGDKSLYSAAGICEFFSIAPDEFTLVTFDSFEEANDFVQKKYRYRVSCIFITETSV